LIDRQFNRAAAFMAVGTVLSFFGFIRAGQLTAAGALYHIGWASSAQWAIGYALCAALFFAVGRWGSGETREH
jgi:hypothetical protein